MRKDQTLFAVGPREHPHSCATLLGTHGDKPQGWHGSWQQPVAGVRAEREGETGGFPLIIYSLSLAEQAMNCAKLSSSSVPFEASGCLSKQLPSAHRHQSWRRGGELSMASAHWPPGRARAIQSGDGPRGLSPPAEPWVPGGSGKMMAKGTGYAPCLARGAVRPLKALVMRCFTMHRTSRRPAGERLL